MAPALRPCRRGLLDGWPSLQRRRRAGGSRALVGRAGSGVFSRTQSIQRLKTVGGNAPADGCNQAQAGKQARVDYKATYYFYKAAP